MGSCNSPPESLTGEAAIPAIRRRFNAVVESMLLTFIRVHPCPSVVKLFS
jgi:hypothetical protein